MTREFRSPAERSAPLREAGGGYRLRVMDLAVGDVVVYPEVRGTAVVIECENVRRDDYRLGLRYLDPPREVPVKQERYYLFPMSRLVSGLEQYEVDPMRTLDPAQLPALPFPDVPERFAPGDRVVRGEIVWTREPSGVWTSERSAGGSLTDERARELFTHPEFLRYAATEYLPATE
ncbi:hypothetical protein ACFRMQ_21675 [Kitasatospora sp. NPDC056783]|uniref:hypothetical protein n=1 Tax=Kitasatospora sp. NPDC056783 TaxID=3345943 RepID=UPI00368147B9